MTYALLTLPNGHAAKVDEGDLPLVSQHKWYARPRDCRVGGFYVCGKFDGTTYLHRFLLDAPSHLHVDHINGDGLDNRRCNLRLATPSQNNANRRFASPRSGFRGVEVVRRYGQTTYRAQIGGRGCKKNGPYRKNAVIAAIDYDKLAAERYGEFASLNFPCVGRAP